MTNEGVATEPAKVNPSMTKSSGTIAAATPATASASPAKPSAESSNGSSGKNGHNPPEPAKNNTPGSSSKTGEEGNRTHNGNSTNAVKSDAHAGNNNGIDRTPNDHNSKSPPKADDEEARLREILSKKKIIQKQIRRKHSGVDAPSAAAEGGGTGGSPSKNGGGDAASAGTSKKPPGHAGKRDSKDGDAGGRAKADSKVGGANGIHRDGKTNSGAADPNNPNPNTANNNSRRRRRRNRGARAAARHAGVGGRVGGPGPPLPDSRSFYGGGGMDHRGGGLPGPSGGYFRDRGGRWERDRRYRGPSRDRGGGYYGGPDDRYRDERDRGVRPRGGGGWRGDRDPRGPPPPRGPRERGGPRQGARGGAPLPDERGRSRSRSYTPSSRSSRSYSSASSRSRSSGSRSYSSRSRSRSYSPSASRSRSRSYSRSVSRSRSPSPGAGKEMSHRAKERGRSPSPSVEKERRRGQSRSRSPSTGGGATSNRQPGGKRKCRSRSRSPSPSASESKRQKSQSRSDDGKRDEPEPSALTKDQRTIFVSQLVMRADDRDIRRYFKRKIGVSVRDVILLRDKRTGRHKGCAYVELGSLGDVETAMGASGKNPDFQRFPLLIKRTEAEKNYGVDGVAAGMGGVDQGIAVAYGNAAEAPSVMYTADGRRIEAQKVYVGNVDRCVTQAQLFALFSQFGPLEKVLLQMDPTTGISRGFAFLSFLDPKDANLAIQTMSGQLLVGRPLKTGWANQQSSVASVQEVRSDQFPDDANEKVQKVNLVMIQLTGAGLTTMLNQVDPSQHQALLASGPAGALGILPTAQLNSVAEAALDMALGETPTVPTQEATTAATGEVVPDAKIVGRSENPSTHILVHNMFDKDEETEQGWEEDIKLDFEEECSQYGKIFSVLVMSKEPGGKIYASFDSVDSATNCAKALAGRWFDKRQLRVEFVDSVPN
mmetsp:Transcript_26488/g.55595  ORF Transcript_26488/g.55595 Transcript_26488/m.55595 type:complete len:937 (+) Transcript_26488:62-2872(+)